MNSGHVESTKYSQAQNEISDEEDGDGSVDEQSNGLSEDPEDEFSNDDEEVGEPVKEKEPPKRWELPKGTDNGSPIEPTQRTILSYPLAFRGNGLQRNQRLPKIPQSQFFSYTVEGLREKTNIGGHIQWDTNTTTYKFPLWPPLVRHTGPSIS